MSSSERTSAGAFISAIAFFGVLFLVVKVHSPHKMKQVGLEVVASIVIAAIIGGGFASLVGRAEQSQ